MSSTLMKHVRVLLVGVALIAMTLAMAPGAANAETIDGQVDAALNGNNGGTNKGDGGGDTNESNGGADLEGKADGGLKGDAGTGDGGGNLGDTTADSNTTIDENVNPDNLQQDGTVDNTNDVDAPAVPASGTVKIDGNGAVDDTLNQDLNSCTDVNASGCAGGDAAPDNGGSGIDLNEPLADLGAIDANSVTNSDQQVNDDPLQSNGNTISNTDVDAPAVPASGTAELNGNVTEGDTLNQDASVCGTLNAENCGGDTTPAPESGAGIDLAEPVGGLGDTTANSDTTIDENVNPDNLQQDGAVDNTTDVDAPAVPASGTANLNGNAEVGDTLNQDLNSCTDVNASGCGDNAAPDNGGSGIDLDEPLADLRDIDANSGTLTEQRVSDDPLQSDGNTTSNTDVEAPAVPASAMAELDANVTEGDTLNQDASFCGTLNAENCGGNTAPAPGSGGPGGIDLDDPLDLDGTTVESATDITENLNPTNPTLDGAVNDRNDIDAPAVPASGTVKIDGNGAVDDTLNQDVSSCTDVNASGCAGGDAAPAPDSDAGIDLGGPVGGLDDTTADSDTITDQQVNDDPLQQDGTLANRNAIVAPAVPASGTAELNGNAVVDDTLNQDVSSCTDLNAAGCGGEAAPAPASDAGTSPAGDAAPAPENNAGSDNNNAGSGDNADNDSGSNSGSDSGNGVYGGNDRNPGDSGSSSSDDSGELAFAAPADSSGSNDGADSSDGSGSPSDSDERASAANLFERGSQTLAANPIGSRTFVALSAGPSGDRDKASSASSGFKTKSGELPDTGGITPLVLVAGLLFMSGGILLVTRRRRFDS